jgi:hypothetical protein
MTEAIDIEMSENGFDSERKVLDAPGTALMKISGKLYHHLFFEVTTIFQRLIKRNSRRGTRRQHNHP